MKVDLGLLFPRGLVVLCMFWHSGGHPSGVQLAPSRWVAQSCTGVNVR
ncbi:hypothetical protein HMPREF9621_01417 [Cutibacterium modestum HL037PA2]|nr:hypothetical protein HMPREF9621_01417 [Cutibacterium modestum HL037PA2]